MNSTDLPSETRLRLYPRNESIVFHKTREAFGGLSNMASGFPLQIGNVRIATSEALYQACRFPHLPSVQREIVGQLSPMTAKMKSKPFRHETRADWENVRGKVMRWCLRVKLAQNYERFSTLLLSTGDKFIVEYSPKDEFWGAHDLNRSSLVGENVLGRLLMELRELIRADTERQLLTVAPLNIPEFHFLGQPICTITPNSTPDSGVSSQAKLL